jgi:hypothetical protein
MCCTSIVLIQNTFDPSAGAFIAIRSLRLEVVTATLVQRMLLCTRSAAQVDDAPMPEPAFPETRPATLKLRRIAIDTYCENVAYLHRDLVRVAHAEPPASTDAVRRKIGGERLTEADFHAIADDIVRNRYSKMEMAAFLVASGQTGLDREKFFCSLRENSVSREFRCGTFVAERKYSVRAPGGIVGLYPTRLQG